MTYPITRQFGPNAKGSELSFTDMDNNLLYLDAKVTGSNNYITLFSGSSAISSSIIYQGGSNIGIGTTNPYSIFNVVGITTIGYPGVSSNSYIQFWPNVSGESAYYITDSGSVLRIGTGEKAFSGTDVLNIASTNVGIGTDNPQAKFVISNNGAQGMEFGYSDILTSSYVESFNRATNLPIDMTYYLGPGTGSHRFYTNGGQRMVINKDGAVGINNAAPVAALDVIGTTIIRGGDLIISSSYPRLYLTDTDSNSDFSIINDNGALNIYDDTNGASRIYISSGGNVGIGGVSTGAKLDINGDIRAYSASAGRVIVGNFSNDTNAGGTEVGIRLAHNNADVCSVNLISQRVGGDAGADFSIETANSSGVPTERFRITEGGNVGVGTSTPQTKFVISNNGSQSLEFGYSATLTSSYVESINRVTNLTSDICYYLGPGNASHRFFNNGVERMRISPTNGNIGIGITSPVTKLDIRSSDANDVLFVTNTNASFANSVAVLNTSRAAITSSFFIYGVASGSATYLVSTNGSTRNNTGVYGAISDVKLKENIVNATPKLEKLKQVRVVNYNFKESLGYDPTKQIGVIAQELEQIFPGLIEEIPDRDAKGKILKTTTKSVKYSVFVPILIKAVQEQQAQIEILQQQVNTLISGSK